MNQTMRNEKVLQVLTQGLEDGKFELYQTERERLLRVVRDALDSLEPVLPGEEIVRVLRLVEYEGPRKEVEEQVRNSIHGTRMGMKCVRITAVTLDQFPEVLVEARNILCPKALLELRSENEKLWQEKLSQDHPGKELP